MNFFERTEPMRMLSRNLAGVAGALILAPMIATAPAGAAMTSVNPNPPAAPGPRAAQQVANPTPPPAADAPAAPKVKHTLPPGPAGMPAYCRNPHLKELPQCGGKGKGKAYAPTPAPAPATPAPTK
jgi:hypothetical protein